MNELAIARIGKNKIAPARCFNFYQNVGIFYFTTRSFEKPVCLYKSQDVVSNFNQIYILKNYISGRKSNLDWLCKDLDIEVQSKQGMLISKNVIPQRK